MRIFALLVLALLVSGDFFENGARAEAAYSLRIATLAPMRSPLGEEYQKIRKGMKERTDGQVNVQYYGGVAGDEETVVRKMRVGQLDGALLTSTGLGALVPQVLVLQAPGVIKSYSALDRVREELGPELEKMFDDAGYELVAWGDAGLIRLFSTKKIMQPSDLQKVRPWVWRDSPTMKSFITAAGANGVALNVPEVYSALQTGMVDTVIASSIAVLAFQWHTKLKTMTKQASGVVVGAFIIKKDRLAALPKDAQDYIRERAQGTQGDFRKISREIDADAHRLLTERLEVVNPWRYQREWEKVQLKAREALVGRVYSRSLLDRVQHIVDKTCVRCGSEDGD
jgi:TRAP-type transport system periplasmic protein